MVNSQMVVFIFSFLGHFVTFVGRIDQVTLHRARLVLRWVTICGYTVLKCNQPLRPTQLPTHTGTGNVYRPKGSGRALRLGR